MSPTHHVHSPYTITHEPDDFIATMRDRLQPRKPKVVNRKDGQTQVVETFEELYTAHERVRTVYTDLVSQRHLYETRLNAIGSELAKNPALLCTTGGAGFAELIIHHKATVYPNSSFPAYESLQRGLLSDAVEIAGESHGMIAAYLNHATDDDVVLLANAIFRGDTGVFHSKRIHNFRRQVVFIFVRRLRPHRDEHPTHMDVLAELIRDLSSYEDEYFHQLFRPIPISTITVRTINQVHQFLYEPLAPRRHGNEDGETINRHNKSEHNSNQEYMMKLLISKAEQLQNWHLLRDRAAKESVKITENVVAEKDKGKELGKNDSKRGCSCDSFKPFIEMASPQNARLFIEKLFQHDVAKLIKNNFGQFVESILEKYPEYLSYIASNLITADPHALPAAFNHRTGNYTVQKILESLWYGCSIVPEYADMYAQLKHYVQRISHHPNATCSKHVMNKIVALERLQH